MSFLVKHGAIRPDYKPIWLEVYEAFPPLHEPRWDRKSKKDGDPVPKILYKEDVVRARFYRQFGERHEVYRMNDNCDESLSQRFVTKYAEEERKNPAMTEDELFDQTLDKLELEGLHLRTVDPEAARKGIDVDRSHEHRREGHAHFREREARVEKRNAERAEWNRQQRLERPSFEELFKEAAEEEGQETQDGGGHGEDKK